MTARSNMVFAEVRRRQLMDLLQDEGRVSVSALCEHFEVSPATIRADLKLLEKLNLLKRTHGGAIRISDGNEPELTSREKTGLHIAQKRAISQYASSLVLPDKVIAIDTGTTTLELAKLITQVHNLTVITNDLKIALFLEEHSNITVIFLGGTVRQNFHCTVGQTILDQLECLHIDTFFLATNAINLEWGLSTPNLDMANVKSKILSRSKQSVLLADSSKIGADALARFATMNQINMLITDSGIDQAYLAGIEATGVQVVCV